VRARYVFLHCFSLLLLERVEPGLDFCLVVRQLGLAPLHRGELLFFEHLHPALLEDAGQQHLHERLRFVVEVEGRLVGVDLGLLVDPRVNGHRELGDFLFYDELCLGDCVVVRGQVCLVEQLLFGVGRLVLFSGRRLFSPVRAQVCFCGVGDEGLLS
jgi:hypothetical protein